MKAPLIAVAQVLALACLSSVHGQEFCPSFAYEPLASCTSVAFRYSHAVLRIENGNETGTGYLVDAEAGVVVTARHVVEAAIRDSSPILGYSPRDPNRPLKLVVVKEISRVDLAVLGLESPTALSGVKSLEVGLEPPQPGVTMCALGYPDGTGELATKTAFFVRTKRSTSRRVDASTTVYEAQHPAFAGESGSPIVDLDGTVVATAVEALSGTHANYVPTQYLLPILAELPSSESIRRFDDRIRGGTIDRAELRTALHPSSSTIPSAALYTWAAKVAQEPIRYVPRANLFACPIIPALIHRKLDDAVLLLGSLARSEARGRAALRVAEREVASANMDEAARFLDVAGESLRLAISNHTRASPEGALFALCEFGLAAGDLGQETVLGSREELLRAEGGVECSAQSHDPFLAWLLLDYAKVGVIAGRNGILNRATAEAVTASTLATRGLESTELGAAYAMLGDALAVEHELENAAAAYAAAYAAGQRFHWIEDNWDWVVDTGSAEDPGFAAKYRLVDGIAEAPSLGTDLLRALVTGIQVDSSS